MAQHLQNQILDAIQAALLAADTVAGLHVYLDRTDELPSGDLASIDILGGQEVGEESIEYLTMNWPPVQQRSYTFAIVSVARGAVDSSRAARNLAQQVEESLLATSNAIVVGGMSIDMLLAESSERKDGSGEIPLAAVRQMWQAQYSTTAGTPDVPR